MKYWVEAFLTANHIVNLLPSASLKTLTPFEVLNNKKPDYSYLRVFGSACYPCLRPYAAHKFEPRSLQCVFLGYNAAYKGYRCLYPPTGRVYISRNVIFDECMYPFIKAFKHLFLQYPTALLQAWQSATKPPPPINQEVQRPVRLPVPPVFHPPVAVVQSQNPPAPEVQNNEAHIDYEQGNNELQDVLPPVQEPVNTHPMATRAKAGISKPNPRYVLLTDKVTNAAPRSVTAALKDPRWTNAMTDEMDTQYENKTFHLVPYDSIMLVLGSGWVYRHKLNADGTEDKCKVRLVVKGNNQEEGVDYLETFSPVVRTSTIRMVLGVAVAKGWSVTQLDVKATFLHGDLTEDIYMSQPPGFVSKEHPEFVCKLDKAIYGLKQVPRAWYDKFSSFLLEYGFTCSKADPSMFTYYHNGNTMVLLLYVDDIVSTGSDPALFRQLIDALSTQFSMKDLGSLHYFLGIQVEKNSEGMFLCQRKYTEEILELAGMESCNPMPMPLPLQMFPSSARQSELFPEPSYFRSLAGKLQYLTLTRPIIKFAVNFVCKRMHAPTQSDFCLLKRILRYLRGTSTLGLHLKKDSSLAVLALFDSDWAGCHDTRRSTTGLCTYLGHNLVSWSAKRQTTVSRSSTEAEYRAMAETAAELTWIAFILRDLNIAQDGPAILCCDNSSAIHLTTNPAFHARSKHFETD